MSQNFETQVCQYNGVRQIESIFADKGNIVEQGLVHLFITQVVLICSIKPISSSIFLRANLRVSCSGVSNRVKKYKKRSRFYADQFFYPPSPQKE